MATKAIKLFCYSCDVEYTVKLSEEVSKIEPEFCPFCSESIETDDGDIPEEEDEEGSDW